MSLENIPLIRERNVTGYEGLDLDGQPIPAAGEGSNFILPSRSSAPTGINPQEAAWVTDEELVQKLMSGR